MPRSISKAERGIFHFSKKNHDGAKFSSKNKLDLG